MLISDLLARTGAHKRRKRIGRGIGSGHGKTAGRGTKGMGAHSSDRPHRMNEGGQMPLVRRIPKRGFSNARFRTEYQVVNVATLEERFESGARVTAEALKGMGLIHDAAAPVKILGTGELTKRLEVEATAFSKSATDKISRAGGQTRHSENARRILEKAAARTELAARRAKAAEKEQAARQEAAAKKESAKAEAGAKKERAPKKEQGEKKKGGKKEPASETKES